MSNSVTGLAVDLLLARRLGDADAGDRARFELARLDDRALQEGLPDDGSRLAFWIDIYNAAVQEQPLGDLTTLPARTWFFRRRVIDVAGQPLSLDAIEHGILRRSHWKLGLGYATNPLPSPFERRHRVAVLDPRIHFALNCGATSCPPIAAYRADRIDAQLEMATQAYLRAMTTGSDDALVVPTLLLWFIGDFGGPPGVRRFLREQGIAGWGRPLRFAAWDWTPQPDHWAPEAATDMGSGLARRP